MNTNNFYDAQPTYKQIGEFILQARSQIENINRNQTQRMENYYNCLDDYSYGGICDKAGDEHRGQLQRMINILQEQLAEPNHAFIQEFETNMLADLQGNVVSEKIIDAKFGRCWLIDNGSCTFCVGCARKTETYKRKGYKLLSKVYTVEYYYTTRQCRDGLITEGRILTERIEDAGNVDYAATRLNSIAYFALLNNKQYAENYKSS